MYSIPELYGTRDYLCDVEPGRLEACAEECTFTSDIHCDEDIHDLACMYMEENGWSTPTDPYSAADLYLSLRTHFLMDL